MYAEAEAEAQDAEGGADGYQDLGPINSEVRTHIM